MHSSLQFIWFFSSFPSLKTKFEHAFDFDCVSCVREMKSRIVFPHKSFQTEPTCPFHLQTLFPFYVASLPLPLWRFFSWVNFDLCCARFLFVYMRIHLTLLLTYQIFWKSIKSREINLPIKNVEQIVKQLTVNFPHIIPNSKQQQQNNRNK